MDRISNIFYFLLHILAFELCIIMPQFCLLISIKCIYYLSKSYNFDSIFLYDKYVWVLKLDMYCNCKI